MKSTLRSLWLGLVRLLICRRFGHKTDVQEWQAAEIYETCSRCEEELCRPIKLEDYHARGMYPNLHSEEQTHVH